MTRTGWAVLLCAALSGCATSYNVATEQQESLFMSTAKEVQLGQRVANRFEEQYPPVNDPEKLARIDRLGQKIVAVSDRRELPYHFGIFEEEEPNALAFPGGFIYVTTGLLELDPSDDELASVLGHEVGHVVARHVVKRIQGQMGLQALQLLVIGAGGTPDARSRQNLDIALASVITAYSQEDELEADRLGTKYLKRSGFDPLAAVSFLTKLRDNTYKKPSRRFSYFRSHPYFSDRIRAVRTEATGRIEFDDYINQPN